MAVNNVTAIKWAAIGYVGDKNRVIYSLAFLPAAKLVSAFPHLKWLLMKTGYHRLCNFTHIETWNEFISFLVGEL